MKNLLCLLVFLLLGNACSQIHSDLVIQSNKPDTEFWMDETYIGKGSRVTVKITGEADKRDSIEGRHKIVAKKKGYTDAEVVIQPNRTRSTEAGFNFFTWIPGVFAYAPIWAYIWLDDYNYIPDKDHFVVDMRFND